MTVVNLNRLLITGPIDDMTPTIVLKEIGEAHGLEVTNSLSDIRHRSRYIDLLMNHAIHGVNLDRPTIQDQRRLVTFVNRAVVNWTLTSLREAVRFLIGFVDTQNQPVIDDNTIFGPQTSYQPRAVNACLLYRLLRHHGVTLNPHTTFLEMVSVAKLVSYDRQGLADLLTLRSSNIQHLSRSVLLNVLMVLPELDSTVDLDRLDSVEVEEDNDLDSTAVHTAQNVPIAQATAQVRRTTSHPPISGITGREIIADVRARQIAREILSTPARPEQRNSQGTRPEQERTTRTERIVRNIQSSRDEVTTSIRPQRVFATIRRDGTVIPAPSTGPVNMPVSGAKAEPTRSERSTRVTYEQIATRQRTISRTGVPMDELDAIVLGALLYQVDLWEHPEPMTAYRSLMTNREPSVEIVRLDQRFQPLFPVELYNRDTLATFLTREGWVPVGLTGSLYEMAQAAILIDNFYLGNRLLCSPITGNRSLCSPITGNRSLCSPITGNRSLCSPITGNRSLCSPITGNRSLCSPITGNRSLRSLLTSTETPIVGYEVDDLSDNMLICYGPRDGPLVPFCVDELSGAFTHSRSFANPAEPPGRQPWFPEHSIEKLWNTTNEILNGFRSGFTVPEMDSYRNLKRAIFDVRRVISDMGTAGSQLLTTYNTSSTRVQAQIRDAFTKLEEMAMTMRGWVGTGPYPVVETPVDNEEAVITRCNYRIGEFVMACEQLGDIGVMIKNLPLVRWNGDVSKFVASSSTSSGLTIADRIAIVEQRRGIESCIRISSNYFGSSSHRYMSIIGMTPLFEIRALRNIS
jgi:hypothetical protein